MGGAGKSRIECIECKFIENFLLKKNYYKPLKLKWVDDQKRKMKY